MSGNPQAVFTASLKGNVSDDPWLVVNAGSVSELLGLLGDVDAVVASRVRDAQDVYRAGLALQGGGMGPVYDNNTEPPTTSDWPPQRPEPQPTPIQNYQRTKPQAAPEQTGDSRDFCVHGRRNRVGPLNGARGQYVAHFCALPKGTQGACKPIFEDA